VLSVFNAADARICSLECVVPDVGQPWGVTPKVFHFRTDEKNIAILKAAGIDAVSVANNHVLDFEYEAMFRMIEVLADHGVNFAGIGRNLLKASRPAIWTTLGKKIGLIAFTNNERGWEATDDKPGVFYVPTDLTDRRAAYLFELVHQTSGAVDVLIVSAHWGPNWGYRPQPPHIPFARTLIDSGADIIFGHSCHVFQGIEVYEGKPILYSTGDFIDDYAVDEIEKNDQSFIFMVDVDSHQIRT
jgi:poly-gamma-glutamate capsule biosynthesis protein CapA/YwtB (metallophosphatase superfamily)